MHTQIYIYTCTHSLTHAHVHTVPTCLLKDLIILISQCVEWNDIISLVESIKQIITDRSSSEQNRMRENKVTPIICPPFHSLIYSDLFTCCPLDLDLHQVLHVLNSIIPFPALHGKAMHSNLLSFSD